MKIDVRGLKKIASDKKSSTFLTAKGHKFIVAHNALDKTNLKQLGQIPVAHQEQGPGTNFSNVNNMPKSAPSPLAMAEGGGIGGQEHPMFHGVKNKIYNWSGHQQDPQPLTQEVKGNPVEQDTVYPTAEPMSQDQYKKTNAPVQSEDIDMAQGGMVKHYAEGTTNVTAGNPDQGSLADQSEAANKLGLTKYIPAINAAPLPSDQADASTQGAIGAPPPILYPLGWMN